MQAGKVKKVKLYKDDAGEQKGDGIVTFAKEEGLAASLIAGTDDEEQTSNSARFGIQVELTPSGLEQVDRVLELVCVAANSIFNPSLSARYLRREHSAKSSSPTHAYAYTTHASTASSVVPAAADEDAVGLEEVVNRRALREELGVGENLEFSLGGAVLENGFDCRSSADRKSGFFHNNFVGGGNLGDFACAEFDIF